MQKKITNIVEMLMTGKYSNVNAGLNRVKGMIEDCEFGIYQSDVKQLYTQIRGYDATRMDMVYLLLEIRENVTEEGKVSTTKKLYQGIGREQIISEFILKENPMD